MGENPLARRDLVAAITELRQEAERRLLANKYYVAMIKLDELLAALRPLDIIDATATPEAPARREIEARSETREAAITEAGPVAAEAEIQAAPGWSAGPDALQEPRWDAEDEPLQEIIADSELQTEPEWGGTAEAELPEQAVRPWLEPRSNLRAS